VVVDWVVVPVAVQWCCTVASHDPCGLLGAVPGGLGGVICRACPSYACRTKGARWAWEVISGDLPASCEDVKVVGGPKEAVESAGLP
jgi:hypothetical protein